MTTYARAFLAAALAALVFSAALGLASKLGIGATWSASVHLAMYGWATAAIYAVSYHTMPVFTAREFPTRSLMWPHFGAFAAGSALAVAGQLTHWQHGVQIGYALELVAASLFLVNVWLLVTRGPARPMRPPAPNEDQPALDRLATGATVAATVLLPASLALLLAARLGRLGGAWQLAAHHLAVLGWVLTMIFGVSYRVLSRFSGRRTRGPRWARRQLALYGPGLALLVAGAGLRSDPAFGLGAVAVASSIGLFAWIVWPTLQPAAPAGGRGPLVATAVERGR